MVCKITLIIALCVFQSNVCMELTHNKPEAEMLEALANITSEMNSDLLTEAATVLNNLRIQKKSPEKNQEIRLIDKALFGLVLRWQVDNETAVRVATMLCDAGADPLAKLKVNERLDISIENKHYTTTEHSYHSTAKAEAKGSLKQYLDSLASR